MSQPGIEPTTIHVSRIEPVIFKSTTKTTRQLKQPGADPGITSEAV